MKCKQKAGILDSSRFISGELDFEKTALLNQKIAQNCITKIRDNNNTAIVLEASKKGTVAKISLYKNTQNTFFKILNKTISSPEFSIEAGAINSIENLEKNLTDYDTLIISLFVPKAKPLNKFDMDEEVLAFLKNAFSTKKCILYVFGNPYALQVIPNLESALGIVQVYQDFTEFQETAAQQLLNNLECKGTLPVIINGL